MQGLCPHKGSSNIAKLSYEDRARLVAWVPQIHEIVCDVKVKKLLEFTALKFCHNAEHAEQMILPAFHRQIPLIWQKKTCQHCPAANLLW